MTIRCAHCGGTGPMVEDLRRLIGLPMCCDGQPLDRLPRLELRQTKHSIPHVVFRHS